MTEVNCYRVWIWQPKTAFFFFFFFFFFFIFFLFFFSLFFFFFFFFLFFFFFFLYNWFWIFLIFGIFVFLKSFFFFFRNTSSDTYIFKSWFHLVLDYTDNHQQRAVKDCRGTLLQEERWNSADKTHCFHLLINCQSWCRFVSNQPENLELAYCWMESGANVTF